jgi:hypothetical protein
LSVNFINLHVFRHVGINEEEDFIDDTIKIDKPFKISKGYSETVMFANVLSVLRFAVSDYLFGIFKLFSLIKEQTI